MAQSKNFERGLAAVKKSGQFIEPGSEAHQELLEMGYGMNAQRAQEIVDLSGKNPMAFPYEVRQKAQALLDALKARPVAISKYPGWKRDSSQFFGGIS